MTTASIRVPLRITLAGGGSDNPQYARRFGGFFISATIDKYLTVSLHQCRNGVCQCRNKERVDLRYSRAAGIPLNIYATAKSDVPKGSGLGASGALMVALLKLRHPELEGEELAGAAYNIERYSVGNPTGIQDAWIASLGGCHAFWLGRHGQVRTEPIALPEDLAARLAMFSTGRSRDAATILSAQSSNFVSDCDATEAMHEIVDIGIKTHLDLVGNGARGIGPLMHAHWLAKRKTGPTSTDQIDTWYELARENGAEGGKCIGAGAGGYMLFVCPLDKREHLIATMSNAGLVHTPFQFVNQGIQTC